MSVLFSGDAITRQPTMKDIEAIGVRNPIVNQALLMVRLGQLSKEDSLLLMVALLSHQNDTLFKTLSQRSINGLVS